MMANRRILVAIGATCLGVLLASARAHAATLVGDCNGNNQVTIGEVTKCGRIHAGALSLSDCTACDQNCDGTVTEQDVENAGHCFSNPAAGDCPMVVCVATPTPTSPGPSPTKTTGLLPLGSTCSSGGQCQSTFCTDGVCCDSSSCPTGQSCNVSNPGHCAAGPTATSAPATNTPGATVTPTNTVGAATPTPTATTGGGGMVIHVGLAPGGGSQGNCRGTCSGGDNAGKSCGVATDCPGGTCGGTRTCVGGAYNGKTCVAGPAGSEGRACNGCDPNSICTAAMTPLTCCTGPRAGTCPAVGACAFIQATIPSLQIKVPLNGVCVPRHFPPGDVSCTTDVECHTCVGGDDNGKTCTTSANCANGGTCTGSGKCQLASVDLVEGTENANHEIPLVLPKESLVLNPAVVSPFGTVCVTAGGDGVGVIDCDGGRMNLNTSLSRDHNTSSVKVCTGGTNAGQPCTDKSQCPGTASQVNCVSGNSGSAMGLPDDPTCTASFQEPDGTSTFACLEGTKQCAGGTNGGKQCATDTDCPGSSCSLCSIGATHMQCSADSTNAGTPCAADPACTGGGKCNVPRFVCLGGTKIGQACMTNADCTGGGTCVLFQQHPGVCNSPTQAMLSGTFAAGDTQVAMPLAITLEAAPAATPPADFGPDNLPCTPDDTVEPAGSVPVVLSTGTNQMFVYDVNNVAGSKIAPGAMCGIFPCIASITGHGVSCTDLTSGNVSGAVLGGGFPAVDTPAGDIVSLFQFSLEPRP